MMNAIGYIVGRQTGIYYGLNFMQIYVFGALLWSPSPEVWIVAPVANYLTEVADKSICFILSGELEGPDRPAIYAW